MLHYVEYGGGPPLLVLHGLFGSGSNWRSLARAFADTHRVVVADLRNHGLSLHLPRMRYLDMAEDLRELLYALGIDRAQWIGHSMGGKAAMTVALRYPEVVGHLVVIDIAPVAYRHDHGHLVAAMTGLDLDRIRSRNQAEEALRDDIPDDVIRRFLLQNLVLDQGRYRWRLNLPALQRDMDEIVGFPPDLDGAHFPGPSLFVAGGASNYIAAGHHGAIRGFFPRAEIQVIDGAGHWVHVDKPEPLVQAIRRFLET